MSELGLRFEDAPSRGRHRHRRAAPYPAGGRPDRPPAPPKRRRGRTMFAFLMVVLLLGGLGAGAYWGFNWVRGALSTPDYAGPGTGSVTVEIKPGQTASEIAVVLHEADVVASPRAFVDAANANPLSVNIQPGFYELRQQMQASDAVAALLDLENRVVETVTIPEGLSSFRTYDLLSEELGIPVEDFEAAGEDPVALGVPEFWFNRDDGKESVRSIEGFLFPATYEFPPEPTAEQVLETMVGQFLTITEDTDFVDVVENERNLTPYEALIVASLTQAESGTSEDFARVARVAYNRVFQADMPLQFDVTANYWLEVQGGDPKHSGELTESELDDPDNPYNTDSVRGLPLGPINNPGQEALEGAMNPADGNWLFFVAINEETGESAFASTLDEHQANIQQACANGVPLSQC